MIEKRNKKNINGILLLDKPIDITSNGALQRVKYLFGAKKAGHTGSLDPLATGMLPICFGEATKFSQYLLESDKQYSVVMKLGEKTTTGDAEGDIVLTRPVENITPQRINEILKKFIGKISQVPPMFSAIKQGGRPLYELARQGVEVPRIPRSVTIYHLVCHDLKKDLLSFTVKCSKGTYIRTLAEEIGEALGTCAHIQSLHRDYVSPYQEAKMYSFLEIEKIIQKSDLSGLYSLLRPIESSVETLSFIKLSTSAAFYIRMGQSVMAPHILTTGCVRLYAEDNTFMGVGEVLADGRVTPRRLLANQATVAAVRSEN